MPSAAASAAGRARSVCHGSTGRASSSSRATWAATAWSRRPTGPPIWTASTWSRTATSPAIASSMPISQPAALSPNDVGSAGWRSVRAITGVSRCAAARPAAASAAAAASPTITASARRASSIIAVSTMSWLVASWWACSLDRSRSAAASGTTGVAERAASRPSEARS